MCRKYKPNLTLVICWGGIKGHRKAISVSHTHLWIVWYDKMNMYHFHNVKNLTKLRKGKEKGQGEREEKVEEREKKKKRDLQSLIKAEGGALCVHSLPGSCSVFCGHQECWAQHWPNKSWLLASPIPSSLVSTSFQGSGEKNFFVGTRLYELLYSESNVHGISLESQVWNSFVHHLDLSLPAMWGSHPPKAFGVFP